MGYQPIESYGIIGDLHTVALVGINGSIDWLCLPRFDSPSVFAAILDDRKGGRFQIAPAVEGVTSKQLYWPDTNVLVTRFLSPGGVCEITDYMPIGVEGLEGGGHQLVRRVRVVRGSMPFRMICQPAFNYARDEHKVRVTTEGAFFDSREMRLALATDAPLKADGTGAVTTQFTLGEEESRIFLLHAMPPGPGGSSPIAEAREEELFQHTVNFWRRWLSRCRYKGRWREMVYRSALVLKLLTYQPTGAIIAAPTSSLPERGGGERNWDYRYTWIRDASFTLSTLVQAGHRIDEADAFLRWIEARCHEAGGPQPLQPLYRVDGGANLDEEILRDLEGYRGSVPVRIGNSAYAQRQLDLYGELLDAVWTVRRHQARIAQDLWAALRRMIDWVCGHWAEPDEGIWEVRGGPQEFLYSRLMCWVALDRALRLAAGDGLPADVDRWRRVRAGCRSSGSSARRIRGGDRRSGRSKRTSSTTRWCTATASSSRPTG